MRTITQFVTAACVSLAVAASAWAQTAVRPDEWSHGTTLSVSAGVPVNDGSAGALLGGGVGWEMTPWLAVDGTGTWHDAGDDATAFAGAITVRTRLFGQRTFDPFVHAGVGMYRASFGAGATLPAFYERSRANPPATGRTFSNPTLVAGGGVNVFLNRHIALRPEFSATTVFRDGRRDVIGAFVLHAVYHFEDHPVTPARRRQP